MNNPNQSVTPSNPSSPTLQSTNNIDLMKKIAENHQTLDDIQLLTSSKVTDQLKVFLVAQARNELQKIIQLTEFLDRLEHNLIQKVDQAITADSLSLKQYSEVIELIKTLLERSNTIISEVLRDDSLTTITSTTIYQSSTGNMQTMSITSRLQDAQSRERVRNVLQQILNKTENYNPIVLDDYQEQQTTESEENNNDNT